ncbi:protein JINGUBANG-like [Cucurbita pepo subsp. pepo]|uniref:protein JINGUBANG-like n=1 Tax=Cucurbita pepo subsp. pepo TaxID=3664 RepID=UPI000C9D283D|nr:protein JINGUBANG-like [Cucurbita pepo subsp. pepo]
MASLNSPDSSPPNISFSIRETRKTTATATSSTAAAAGRRFYRSNSTKEPSFSQFPFTPPHLNNCPSLPQSFHNSPATSPLHPASTTTTAAAPTKLSDLLISHRCVSSVLKKDGQILSIAIFNDILYTGSDSNLVRIWKLPDFTECGQLKTKASMAVALQVSHDKVYAAYSDCKIRVWRRNWDRGLKHLRLATIPATGNYVRSYISGKDKMMKHMGPITSLAINISDDVLYSSSLDKSVKIWRISDFKCVETIQAHSEPINAIIAADDGLLYTASDDATVRVWRRNFSRSDRPTHSLVVTLPTKFSPVKTLSLATDSGLLYGGCSDGYLHFWLRGWFSGQLKYGGSLQGHTHAVMCLATVGKYVVSGSADTTCRVWARDEVDCQMHTCLAVLVGHRGPVRCVAAFSGSVSEEVVEEADDGCTICSGSLDGVLKVWRVTCTKNGTRNRSLQNGTEYSDVM